MNRLNEPLALAFLFFSGSLIGWVLEYFFRNLISHKGPKGLVFINPGFCKGPYLPIYGFGLTTCFVITYYISDRLDDPPTIVIIAGIAIMMSIIEFIGGFCLLKFFNLRLWDYRDRKGNIMGLVCPLFSLIWGLLGAVYYLFIHPLVIDGLIWLTNNLAFSFFIGLFFGFFTIDICLSVKDVMSIAQFARIHDLVVSLEELKSHVQQLKKEAEEKMSFFNQIAFGNTDMLEELLENRKILEPKRDAFHKKKKTDKKHA